MGWGVLELLCLVFDALFRRNSGAVRGRLTALPALLHAGALCTLRLVACLRGDWYRRWQEKLAHRGVHWQDMTFARFSLPHVVYLRLSLFVHHSYVGRTAVGMVQREHARIRKFHQRRMVNVEPAILWWSHNRSFFRFSRSRCCAAIPLSRMKPTGSTRRSKKQL